MSSIAGRGSGASPQSADLRVRRLAHFARDERGNIFMLLALLCPLILVLGGGAIDMGRFLLARGRTIAAMEAAVLAGGRALQNGAAEEQAIAQARSVYAANTQSRLTVMSDTVSFTVSNGGTHVSAVGGVEIATPFLRLISLAAIPLFAKSEASEATFAQDRFARTNSEVVLALDMSQVMCEPCARKEGLQKAVNAFIATVMRTNATSAYKVRVGLVPYSGDVRPPEAWLTRITDPAAPPWRAKISDGALIRHYKSRCVGERVGAEQATNHPPGEGAFLLAAYARSPAMQHYCQTPPSSLITPLSDEPTQLVTSVDHLSVGAGRAGHVALAWAYYLLSETWQAVLPPVSRPQPFGTENLRKVVILMSAGAYDAERDADGIQTGAPGSAGQANGASAAKQAMNLCRNIKADGIEIFTVGLELNDDAAVDVLEQCASTSAHFYNVADPGALAGAFRDIALKLTPLHLAR